MLRVTDIELDNVVLFKKVRLAVDRHPFTVISGHNEDSRISSETSNGAGKSLLLSSIPNLRYEATPLAQTKSKKDMLTSAAARIKMAFVGNNNVPYSITQTSSKFVIEEDGKDIESRTIPLQKTKIAEIFPITEEEFYSYVYLQSQRPLNFQIDKPAARLQYITSIFRLDVYDQLKKYFTKKLGEIKNKQVEFDVLNQQLVKINGLLERLAWSKESAAELDEAREVIKTLGGDSKTLQSKIQKYKAALAIVEQYDKLKAKRKKLKPPIDLKRAKEERKWHRDMEEYQSELKTYKAQKKQLEQQVEELGKTKPIAVLKKKLKALNAHLKAEEKALTELHEVRQEWKSLEKRKEELALACEAVGLKRKDAPVAVAFGKGRQEEELVQHKAVLQLKSILHDCTDGECPTCMQQVEIDKIRKHIKKAEKAIDKLETHIEQFDAALAYVRVRDKKIKFDDAAFVERRKQYAADSDTFDKLESQFEAATQVEKLTTRLSKLKAPEKVIVEPKYSLDQLEEIFEAHSEIQRIDSVLESLENQHGTIDAVSLSNKLSDAQARYKKIERRYTKAQDICSNLGSKASEYKVLRRERKDALEKLELIKPIIAQRDMFKSLEKGYSAKGLKITAANGVLFQIEQLMNRYSNLIFAEPFKFTLFAKEDGVHCRVDRGNGKESDVRLLSGAESDCFRLLWMWVMLVMVEDDRRTNFCVLDEPDSHMDDTTRSLFVERFIPALRTLVPHVFLVTPLSKHLYSECHYITVTKKGGVSKVVESDDESSKFRLPRPGRSSGEAKQGKKGKAKPSADANARRAPAKKKAKAG